MRAPVVVATVDVERGAMKTIVVGVDGSEHSVDALRWAVDEGRLRNAKVVAVHAWSLPHVSTTHQAIHLLDVDFEPFREGARKLLEVTVKQAALEAEVEIAQVVCEGPPAAALIAAAEDAELLVVGSRGVGGFKGLLLGSVSQQVAHHAPCPVVVVRASVRPEGAQRELTAGRDDR